MFDSIFLTNRGIFIPKIIWNKYFKISIDYPKLKEFNFKGGLCLPPEFLGMFLALSIYYSTYSTKSVADLIISILTMSTLGISVGYADLIHGFGVISLNQTGQAIEIMFLIIVFYLSLIGGIKQISKFICYKFVNIHLLGQKFGF